MHHISQALQSRLQQQQPEHICNVILTKVVARQILLDARVVARAACVVAGVPHSSIRGEGKGQAEGQVAE